MADLRKCAKPKASHIALVFTEACHKAVRRGEMPMAFGQARIVADLRAMEGPLATPQAEQERAAVFRRHVNDSAVITTALREFNKATPNILAVRVRFEGPTKGYILPVAGKPANSIAFIHMDDLGRVIRGPNCKHLIADEVQDLKRRASFRRAVSADGAVDGVRMVAKKHGLQTGGETTVALSDLTKAAIDKLPPSRTPPAHFLPLLEKPRTFHSLEDAMRTMKVARQ